MDSVWRSRVALMAVVIAVSIGIGWSPDVMHAARQTDATPVASVPAAEDCTVQPREFDEIADLADAPAPTTEPATSAGTPADDDGVVAVTATIRLAIACANANDPLRSLALFTDRYVGERFGPEHPDDLGSLNAVLSRTPTPAEDDDLLALVEVRDVVISDRRAEAIVVTENRSARFVDRLTLEQVDDRWLVDSWAPIEERATPTA